MSGDYKFDTLSLHAGHVPDPVHGSRAVPIHQTTSYVFNDSEHPPQNASTSKLPLAGTCFNNRSIISNLEPGYLINERAFAVFIYFLL